MLTKRQKLTTNPLTFSEGVTLQVKDVYVPLGLVERRKQSKLKSDVSPEQGSDLYKETEITKTFNNKEFLEEVLRQKQSPKSQGKRIAIIGEPGAGKTTLLQQIADWLPSEIEQSIVIWISLADLQDKELKLYLFENWLNNIAETKNTAEASKELKEDFISLFNQGRVWLMLDGLDEMSVFSSNPLTEIAQQIREGGCISQARIVLTCRVNLWDGSRNALDDFDIYRTLDFSYPEQVEKFIGRWFSAIQEVGRERGQRLCNALKETGKKRIQNLVKNPLRLTLLCLTWQSREGKLPDTKAALYQQFVDDFYKWKEDQFDIKYEQRKQLNVKLAELAKEAIDKETSRFRLEHQLVSHFLGEANDENSLLKLALKFGWLNNIGINSQRKPVYAFFHPSFQEYFAALYIEDWDYFLPRHHKNKPVKDKRYRIFEPQFQEVVLLWLGRQSILEIHKLSLIKKLLDFQDGCGNFYQYECYIIAAIGIAEFKQVDKELATRIINQLILLAFGFYNLENQQWEVYSNCQTNIRQKAREALLKTNVDMVVTLLNQCLEKYYLARFNIFDKNRANFGNYLEQFCLFLWILNPDREIVSKILIEIWLQNPFKKDWISEDINAMFEETDLFVELYPEKKTTKQQKKFGDEQNDLKFLIQELKKSIDSRDFYNCQTIISKLQQIERSDSEEISILIEVVNQSLEVYFDNKIESAGNALFQAIERLTEIGLGNEKVIDTFVKLIHIRNGEFLNHAGGSQLRFIGGLSSISVANIKILSLLLSFIHHPNCMTRVYAIDGVKRVAQGDMLLTVVKELKRYRETSTLVKERLTFTSWQATLLHCAQHLPYPNFFKAWYS